MRHVARFVVLCSTFTLLASGCGPGPERLGGDVSGNFGAQAFRPVVGIALRPPKVSAALEIQLGESGLTCERYLDTITVNLSGLFATINLPSAEAGRQEAVVVRLTNIAKAGGSQGVFSNRGTVDLNAPDAGRVSGTISWSSASSTTGESLLQGAFDVVDCP